MKIDESDLARHNLKKWPLLNGPRVLASCHCEDTVEVEAIQMVMCARLYTDVCMCVANNFVQQRLNDPPRSLLQMAI